MHQNRLETAISNAFKVLRYVHIISGTVIISTVTCSVFTPDTGTNQEADEVMVRSPRGALFAESM